MKKIFLCVLLFSCIKFDNLKKKNDEYKGPDSLLKLSVERTFEGIPKNEKSFKDFLCNKNNYSIAKEKILNYIFDLFDIKIEERKLINKIVKKDNYSEKGVDKAINKLCQNIFLSETFLFIYWRQSHLTEEMKKDKKKQLEVLFKLNESLILIAASQCDKELFKLKGLFTLLINNSDNVRSETIGVAILLSNFTESRNELLKKIIETAAPDSWKCYLQNRVSALVWLSNNIIKDRECSNELSRHCSAIFCKLIKENRSRIYESLIFLIKKENKEDFDNLLDIYCYFSKKENKVDCKYLLCQKIYPTEEQKNIVYYMAKRRDKKCIEYLLEKGIGINFTDEGGKTAVMFAAEEDNRECLEYLVVKGADIHSTMTGDYNKGKTALMLAVEKGNKECLEYLIDKGSNINSTMTGDYNKGETALMLAVEKGNKEIVEYLVDKGARINLKDKKGKTALMLALHNEYTKTVKYLINKQEFDKNYSDFSKEEIDMSEQYIKCQKHIIEILKKAGAKEDCTISFGCNEYFYNECDALMCAVSFDNKEYVEYLVEKGVDINAVNKEGKTALMLAVEKGNKESVEYLVEKGIDINAKDNEGKTALMLAVEKGNKESVEYLVEKGIDINAKDNEGKTALMYAAERGNKECVVYLVDKGADIHSTMTGDYDNDKGKTTLMFAVSSGNKECIAYLVDKGADINSAMTGDYDKGKTALMYAAERGNKECIEYLLEKGANITDAIIKKYLLEKISYRNPTNNELSDSILSACFTNKERIEYLLKKGVGINKLLTSAVKNGNKEYIEYLIDKGADINVKDSKGRTMLMLAAEKGNKECIEYLLEKGANINAIDKAVKTSLITADSGNKDNTKLLGKNVEDLNNLLIAAVKNGDKERVELLIKEGADVNCSLKTKYYSREKTALMIAAQNGDKEIVEYLVKKGANIHLTIVVNHAERSLEERKCRRSDFYDYNYEHYEDAGKTALNYAAENNHEECAIILIDNGANINSFWKEKTALMYAAERGNKEYLKYLIDKGADINLKDKKVLGNRGKTALYYAVKKGHTEIVEYLINKGANIEANNYGSSYLGIAKNNLADAISDEKEIIVEKKYEEALELRKCVEVLIKAGANLRPSKGYNEEIHVKEGSEEYFELIVKRYWKNYHADRFDY